MSQLDRLEVDRGRSGCPINMTTELLGDRWSLVVLRDLMFGPNRHFGELRSSSLEGIASNILADRLTKLVTAGLLTRAPDPSHKQKVIYSLTEPAIQLLPILAQIGAWGARWLPADPDLRVRADLLAEGGPAMWEAFMDELRTTHLHGRPRPTNGVLDQLDRAYRQTTNTRAKPRRRSASSHR